jgi:hypothetical protein
MVDRPDYGLTAGIAPWRRDRYHDRDPCHRSEAAAMPLLDHFHPPLYPHHHWESFLSNWATRIADGIEGVLPLEFQVEERTHAGLGFEIDLAPEDGESSPPVHASPLPKNGIRPVTNPDTFEVRVFSTTGGLRLVAVIELVSPGNKGCPSERRAFVAKCCSYLGQEVSLIVVDIVTNQRANLHNELLHFIEVDPGLEFLSEQTLYAAGYCPMRRGEQEGLDICRRPLALGAPLPTLPLRLTGDLFLPVDFEAAYLEACRRRRLA